MSTPLDDPKNSIDFAVTDFNMISLSGKVGLTVGSTPVENVCGYLSVQGAPAGGYKRGAGLEVGFLRSTAPLPNNQLSKSADRIEIALFMPIEQMATVVAQLQGKTARIVANIFSADACGLASGK